MVSKCLICNKVFETFPSRQKKGQDKYCSREHYYQSKKGKPPWNKDKKGVQVPWNKGIKLPYKIWNEGRIRANSGTNGIHIWIERHYGKAKEGICENCGVENNIDWSNISGKYTRNREDWQRLCRKCHIAYDKKNIPLAYIKTFDKDGHRVI